MGSIPGSGRSPRVGNGNLLQYSCLENSMDGGVWWASGVTKSHTPLSVERLKTKLYQLSVPSHQHRVPTSLPVLSLPFVQGYVPSQGPCPEIFGVSTLPWEFTWRPPNPIPELLMFTSLSLWEKGCLSYYVFFSHIESHS